MRQVIRRGLVALGAAVTIEAASVASAAGPNAGLGGGPGIGRGAGLTPGYGGGIGRPAGRPGRGVAASRLGAPNAVGRIGRFATGGYGAGYGYGLPGGYGGYWDGGAGTVAGSNAPNLPDRVELRTSSTNVNINRGPAFGEPGYVSEPVVLRLVPAGPSGFRVERLRP